MRDGGRRQAGRGWAGRWAGRWIGWAWARQGGRGWLAGMPWHQFFVLGAATFCTAQYCSLPVPSLTSLPCIGCVALLQWFRFLAIKSGTRKNATGFVHPITLCKCCTFLFLLLSLSRAPLATTQLITFWGVVLFLFVLGDHTPA